MRRSSNLRRSRKPFSPLVHTFTPLGDGFRLERFEKTNEMLSTCSHLLEKRLDKTRREMMANRDLILQAIDNDLIVLNKQ